MFGCGNCVKVRLGVGELLDLLDLQASIIIGNKVCDPDRLVLDHTERQLHIVGGL
jgi:hypothetical protein